MPMCRPFRSLVIAMIAVTGISAAALAQSPGTAPAAGAPAPETSPPSSSTPVPPPAQTPATPPAVKTADPFGEEMTLAPKPAVILKGSAKWETAFETLTDSFKKLLALLEKQGIKPAGNPMIVYISTDVDEFTYQAEIPVEQEPKNLPKDVSFGKTPEGKVLKFVHRGSFDNMENTDEAIFNYLEEKRLEASDRFVDEYVTDPLKTAEDRLVINVYVPLK